MLHTFYLPNVSLYFKAWLISQYFQFSNFDFFSHNNNNFVFHNATLNLTMWL